MSTLPPSGLAPTLPPAPRQRARRAAFFAIAGLALLVTAISCLRLAHAHASRLFAYDNDAAAAYLLARIAFGFSLAAQIASLYDARIAWRWKAERGRVLTAVSIVLVWAASVLWVALGIGR